MSSRQDRLREIMARRRAETAAPEPRRGGPGETVPASFAQRRLLFLDTLGGPSAAYNVPLVFRLTGPLDTGRLRAALRTVHERHEALRTRFTEAGDGVVAQTPGPPGDLAEESAASWERAQERAVDLAAIPFDLTGGELTRQTLIRIDDHAHLLVLVLHHALSDGWSERVVLDELAAAYAGKALPEPGPQYRDHTAWEYESAALGRFEDGLAYWSRTLAGAPADLRPPGDRPRPVRPSGRGGTLAVELPPVTVDGATPFMVALAALAVLLQRYTGSRDQVVGVPVANRERPEFERTVGLFVNSVALRVTVAGTARSLVGEVRDALLAAQDHQAVPFDAVVDRVSAGRDPSVTPLFQVMGNLEAHLEPFALGDVEAVPVQVETPTAKFDLSVHVGPGRATFEYATDLYDRATVARLAGHYVSVLAAFAADPDRPLAELALCPGEERVDLAAARSLVPGATGETALLLDEDGHAVPPGVTGELCFDGVRSGHLARRLTGGGLEYAGARDRAVVLDGVVIAPDLIERALTERVREAAVVVRDGRLIAFVVGDADVTDLLAARFPRSWLPAAVHVVPDLTDLTEPQAPQEPWTDAERRVAEVFEDVLGRPVGRLDDFFSVGGHSLLAIKAVARLGDGVPLRLLFEEPTVAGLTRAMEAHAAGPTRRIVPHDPGTPAPLSMNQEHMWFMEQVRPGDPLYTITQEFELDGPVDVPALRAALTEVVAVHDVLRSRIEVVDGVAAQVPAEVTEADLWDSGGPIDLATGPMVKAELAGTRLRLHVHHIAFDEWSAPVLYRDLALAYEGKRLARPPVQYADYARWQRETYTPERQEADLAYWRDRLAGAPTLLHLPQDRPRPAVRSYRGGTWRHLIGPGLAARLAGLAAAEGATLYMALLAAFSGVLHRYSREHDLLLGTGVTNRDSTEVEQQIGYFLNVLVARSTVTPSTTFRDHLRATRRHVLDGFAHRDLPFAKLVEHLVPERSATHSPLVQVVFTMQDEAGPELTLPGAVVRPVPPGDAPLDMDLLLSVRKVAAGLEVLVDFNHDVFDAGTARRLAAHLETLLASAADDPDAPLLRLPMVGTAERAELIALAEGTDRAPHDVTLVHHLFERQAARTPDAIALVHRGEQLTYARLDGEANALAHRLRELGVGAERVVGIVAERSPETFVSVLAVLKAGGAFLPLDPVQPPLRLRHMLTGSGAVAVLSATELDGVAVVDPRGLEPRADAPPCDAHPESLAYVHYTSGSTGLPKGVAHSHAAMAALMGWDGEDIPVRPGGSVLQYNALTFDPSFLEMFSAWQAGARLIVLDSDEARKDAGAVLDLLEREQVERWGAAYSGVLNVVTWAREQGRPRRLALRSLISGGESLRVTSDLASWFAGLPGCRLINHYGPTEVNTASSHVMDEISEGLAPPIGRPGYRTRFYLLDEHGDLAPSGVPGELYIGGAHLGRGYVARPDLTADRFLPDPFSDEAGARLYRTGDVARLRTDGELEFLGRADAQLKLRGYRIEPEEVEACLAEGPGVIEAAVTVAGQALVALLVAGDGHDPDALREALARKLPDYMIPARFTVVPALPATSSGKLDRSALAELAGPGGAESFAAPRGELEQRMAGLWQRALGAEAVGRDDDFFTLGGHSLLATRLVAQARSEFGREVSVGDLFDAPTLARFAAAVAAAPPEGPAVVRRRARS